MPCIPEDSENIVKQIIRNKLNDSTSSWMKRYNEKTHKDN
jgi:hypothetical protein